MFTSALLDPAHASLHSPTCAESLATGSQPPSFLCSPHQTYKASFSPPPLFTTSYLSLSYAAVQAISSVLTSNSLILFLCCMPILTQCLTVPGGVSELALQSLSGRLSSRFWNSVQVPVPSCTLHLRRLSVWSGTVGSAKQQNLNTAPPAEGELGTEASLLFGTC